MEANMERGVGKHPKGISRLKEKEQQGKGEED